MVSNLVEFSSIEYIKNVGLSEINGRLLANVELSVSVFLEKVNHSLIRDFIFIYFKSFLLFEELLLK